jgi:NhaP-type Na+/H+ or K+/H+ antiporter
VPYASYVLAEELHGSGVLAVLTTALFLAEYANDADDVMTRLAGHTFWDIVDTLVTGVAFGLIGLELHNAIRTASGRWQEMLGLGRGGRGGRRVRTAAVAAAGDLAGQAVARKRDYDEDIPTSWRETVVMWWAGMRGWPPSRWRWPFRWRRTAGRRFPTGTRWCSSRSG